MTFMNAEARARSRFVGGSSSSLSPSVGVVGGGAAVVEEDEDVEEEEEEDEDQAENARASVAALWQNGHVNGSWVPFCLTLHALKHVKQRQSPQFSKTRATLRQQ
jgi:hypothetical protein